MRALCYCLALTAGFSAAALEIPETPSTATVELQACDVNFTSDAHSRHSTFEGSRVTWTEGEYTYTISKGRRVADDGQAVELETKMRRSDRRDGEVRHETSDYLNTVTEASGATSINLVHQEDEWRLVNGARELVSRVTNGAAAAAVRETTRETTDGPGRRTIATTTTTAATRLRYVCTFTAPTS